MITKSGSSPTSRVGQMFSARKKRLALRGRRLFDRERLAAGAGL
ncbi:hypothetical protein [Anoxybacteroides tepidamans]|nr:hypothetical protein [Anoxybacillus tepidamans]